MEWRTGSEATQEHSERATEGEDIRRRRMDSTEGASEHIAKRYGALSEPLGFQVARNERRGVESSKNENSIRLVARSSLLVTQPREARLSKRLVEQVAEP